MASSNDNHQTWADTLQLAFLDAVTTKSGLYTKEVAFQGGTSLHLGWQSPRLSEDLDFLIAKPNAHRHLMKVMPSMKGRMEQFLLGQAQSLGLKDPGSLTLEIGDKTKNSDRMTVFEFKLSHPSWHRKVKVKTEFWSVNEDYLSKYETSLRMPNWQSDDMVARVQTPPINTATPESILADKVVAIAYRGRVKWRDVFDLWWLDNQLNGVSRMTDKSELAKRAVQHASAYEYEGGLVAGLRDFIAKEKDIRNLDGCDIERWLPDSVVSMFIPDKTQEMVDVTMRYAKEVLQELKSDMSETEVQRQ